MHVIWAGLQLYKSLIALKLNLLKFGVLVEDWKNKLF